MREDPQLILEKNQSRVKVSGGDRCYGSLLCVHVCACVRVCLFKSRLRRLFTAERCSCDSDVSSPAGHLTDV